MNYQEKIEFFKQLNRIADSLEVIADKMSERIEIREDVDVDSIRDILQEEERKQSNKKIDKNLIHWGL